MSIQIEEGMSFLKNGAVYRTTMVSERDGRTTIQIVNNNDIDDVYRFSAIGHPTVDTVESALSMKYIDPNKISVSLEAEGCTIKVDPNPPSMSVSIEPVYITGYKAFEDDMIAVRNFYITSGNPVMMKPFDYALQNEFSEEAKKAIHDMIRISSKVYVVNKAGYIDYDTRDEIDFAKSLNKEIEYFEETNRQSSDEYIKKQRDNSIEVLNQKYMYLMTILKVIEPKIGTPIIDESVCTLCGSELRNKVFEIPTMAIVKINYEPKLVIYTSDLMINISVEYVERDMYQIRINVVYYKQDTDIHCVDKCYTLHIVVFNKESSIDAYSIDIETKIPDVSSSEVYATKVIADAIKDFFKDKIKEENEK